MKPNRPHKKLDVWTVSMELCRDVYSLCRDLPPEEKYGIAAQMKRASVSVPSNIAEGAARDSRKEFLRFLSIAQGSLAELDTQLELCCNYFALLDSAIVEDVLEKVTRVAKMITALKRSLRKRNETTLTTNPQD